MSVGRVEGVKPKIEIEKKPEPQINNQPQQLRANVQETANKLLESAFTGLTNRVRLFAAQNLQAPGGGQPNLNAPATFTAENTAGRADLGNPGRIDEDATPEEAAQYILNYPQNSLGGAYPGQQQFFLQAIEQHKNDPNWIQGFFRHLGAEQTAELISDSITSGVHQYSSPEQIEQQVGALRDAITNLASAQPPLFTQADMDLLVEKMVKAPGDMHALIAMEVFGKMGYEHENVKNMFFDAASRLALSDRVSESEAEQLSAAAAHMLSNTSANNQAEKLNALRESGSGNLTKFIQFAMNGATEYPPLASQVNSNQRMQPVEYEPYGRVDALLFNMAYSGYSDAHSPGPSVSGDDLAATRAELFSAATNALTNDDVRGNYENSTLMKDGLSQIFMRDFDRIIDSSIGTNGASLTTTAQNNFSQFFEYAMFTTEPGHLQKSLMNFVSDKFRDYGQGLQDTSPGAEERFQQQFGRSRADASAIMGGLLGTMTIGLRDHISDIKADAEARGEMLGFIFDLTVGNIPGVGGKLTEGATSIAVQLLGSVVDSVQSEVIDKLKEGLVDQAKEAFINGNRAKDPQELLLGLFEGLNTTIPNGDNPGEGEFLDDFQGAYNTVINNPANVVSGD